jgi:hypothetical protein
MLMMYIAEQVFGFLTTLIKNTYNNMKLKTRYLRKNHKKLSLMYLSDFTQISYKAAVKLRKMKVRHLQLSGLRRISNDSLKILCSAYSKTLYLHALILTEQAATIIAKEFRGRELYLNAHNLSDSVISTISKMENTDCWIVLDNLTDISDTCLNDLTQLKCSLRMRYTKITESQYQKLSDSFCGRRLLVTRIA